ncbi:hypothetical protein RND81_10G050200 [Saponaria officinalis]|uniref:Uncharacterized protein n=1 Tax=Saponaria officinalis TaxID=3572 RepID=A0AAW1I0Y4_SAPOF
MQIMAKHIRNWFSNTASGGFCYSQESVIEFQSEVIMGAILRVGLSIQKQIRWLHKNAEDAYSSQCMVTVCLYNILKLSFKDCCNAETVEYIMSKEQAHDQGFRFG